MEGVLIICLTVYTDGRDGYLHRTIESANENLRGPITRRIIHDDSGVEHGQQLALAYPEWEVLYGEKRLGFGGAIDNTWKFLCEHVTEPFIGHLEDDFTFNKTIPLNGMMRVLEAHPYLTQIALRRQPWNDAERKAGGVVELWPDEYQDREWEGYQWLEHRLFVTTNPSLYLRNRTCGGWPTGEHSEAEYSNLVFADDSNARSAFWGARDSGEWCEHIGMERFGVGY